MVQRVYLDSSCLLPDTSALVALVEIHVYTCVHILHLYLELDHVFDTRETTPVYSHGLMSTCTVHIRKTISIHIIFWKLKDSEEESDEQCLFLKFSDRQILENIETLFHNGDNSSFQANPYFHRCK